MKKVSIIIPVYNKEKYVKESLKSAVNQTYKNLEIVIINDGSTDNSKAIIEDFIKDHKNIIYINEDKNIGLCLARNKAISASSGEYILPLDADDLIDKTYAEKAAKILDNEPDVGVVYCNFTRFQDIVNRQRCKVKAENLIFENYIINGSMYRKEDFYKAGQYKEWLNALGCEDWELWISFYEKGYKFKGIDEFLYHYRIYNEEERMTSKYLCKMKEIELLILEHHLPCYMKNDKFYNLIFGSDSKKNFERAVKYKSLFNNMVWVVAGQFAIIFALIGIIYSLIVWGE